MARRATLYFGFYQTIRGDMRSLSPDDDASIRSKIGESGHPECQAHHEVEGTHG
jgi:hypothetical protein